MSRRRTISSLASIVLATAAAVPAAAPAQVFTWSGAAGNLWSDGANWQGGVAPPADGATTAIVMNGTVQTTNVMNLGAFPLNSLTFSGAADAFTINQSAADSFAFLNSAAGLPRIDQFSALHQTINFPASGLALGADTQLGGTGTGTITFNGLLTSAGRLVMNGPYTFVATSPGAFTHGGMTINAGTLRVAGDANLGTGAVMFGGGTLQFASSTNLNHALALNAGGGTIDANGTTMTMANALLTASGAGRLALTSTAPGAASTTITAQLQHGGGLLVSGANHSVTLNGNNTYTGGTTISGGARLTIDLDERLGAVAGGGGGGGGLTLDNGTLRTANIATTVTSRTITLGAGGGTVDVVAAPFAVNADISGAGGLIKTGPGVLALLAANTYSGATTVSSGTLEAGEALALQNSTLVMSGGAFAFTTTTTGNAVLGGLAGSGNVPLTGPSNVDIGHNGASTTFAGDLTGNLPGLSGLRKVGDGTWTLTGANTHSGPFNIAAGAVVAGSAQALSPNAPITVEAGATLDTGGFGYSVGASNPLRVSSGGTVKLNGNNLDLHGALLSNDGAIVGGGAAATINLYSGSFAAGTGTFPTVTVHPGGSFTPGVSLANAPPPAPAGIGIIAPLDPNQSTAAPVVLAADTTATVTAADNALTLAGGISGPGRTLTKQGAGTLLLQNLRADGLSVDAGLVRILASAAADSGTSTLKTLQFGPAAQLDLGDNKLIVFGGQIGAFTGGGVGYSGLTGRIASSYNQSTWDGPGITTSMTDALPLFGLTTVAISTADAASYVGGTFGGVPVSSGDVLIMYTYAGDLNLDGRIDAQDYGIIDNFVQFPGSSGYANGDINYDGVIDATDYGIIDNTIQLQGPPIPTNQPAAATGLTVVPEPSGAMLLLVPLAALARRRHRCGRSIRLLTK
jgi:autotransporter-associated beta strand protein